MTPYPIFAEVLAAKLQPSFREAWFDFETWERCRNFRDDPKSQSRTALDWIRDLYELSVALGEFPAGPPKDRCCDALESVFMAFARMEHPDELCEAARHWQAARMADEIGRDG